MIYVLICAVVIVLDIMTKLRAVNALAAVDTVPLIDGVLHLTYVENRGAAFGILANKRWVFIVLTVLILAALIAAAFRIKNKPWLLSLAMSVTVGGAIGNMIDRLRLGYVIDFIDFRLINFPVFNVADIFVCIGAGLFMIYFIFEDRLNMNKTEQPEKQE